MFSQRFFLCWSNLLLHDMDAGENDLESTVCLRITEKVSFNITNEASYVTFWVDKSWLKMVHFDLKPMVKKCYQVTFNRPKIGGKFPMRHFEWFSNDGRKYIEGETPTLKLKTKVVRSSDEQKPLVFSRSLEKLRKSFPSSSSSSTRDLTSIVIIVAAAAAVIDICRFHNQFHCVESSEISL